MAYALTARQFFEGFVEGALPNTTVLREVGGVVEFDIQGAEGGSWLVDLAAGQVVSPPTARTPQCIVRAQDRDFMALIEGRMSVSDGLITERLHIAGEAGLLARLFEALQAVRKDQR